MTLEIPCRQLAEFNATLLSVGTGRDRRGAKPATFPLCENHSQLFEQIDQELVQDGWARAHTGPPTQIL